MKKSTSWKEIQASYDGEWVELIEYDWPEGKPFPVSGEVRVHSKNRREFYQQAKVNPPKDSAILYVGKPKIPEKSVLSSSVMQLSNAKD